MNGGWPYPRWVAHRGAGTLAPENTLAAFRLGAGYGWRMGECDVKLSADGIPFLLHDSTLERTTNGHGTAGDRPWDALATLDAGSWHSPGFAGERLASLDDLADWCASQDWNYLVNLEIKPTPGLERRTGEVVARHAAQRWQAAAIPPLLTSFRPEALEGAKAAAPHLPRGLLLDQAWAGWGQAAGALACVAVVARQDLWNDAFVAEARRLGLRCLAYTVNDPAQAERLLALGLDGLITDRVDVFDPRR